MGQRRQSIYTHPCYVRVISYQTHGLTNLPNALVPLFICEVGEEIRVIATQPTFHIRLETWASLQIFLGGGILHMYDTGRLGGRHSVNLQLSKYNQISSYKESQEVLAFILGFPWRPDSQDTNPASIFSNSASYDHLRRNQSLAVSSQPSAKKPIYSGIRENWQKSAYCLYNHLTEICLYDNVSYVSYTRLHDFLGIIPCKSTYSTLVFDIIPPLPL